MDYNEMIKERLEEASETAKKLLHETMKIEKEYRWQTAHRSLNTEIAQEIADKVKEILK